MSKESPKVQTDKKTEKKISEMEFDPKSGFTPLEWLDLQNNTNEYYRRPRPTYLEKAIQQPLVPIGLIVSAWAIFGGLRAIGNDLAKSQRMLRIRWTASAIVFTAILVGKWDTVNFGAVEYFKKKRFQFSSMFSRNDEKEPVVISDYKPVIDKAKV